MRKMCCMGMMLFLLIWCCLPVQADASPGEGRMMDDVLDNNSQEEQNSGDEDTSNTDETSPQQENTDSGNIEFSQDTSMLSMLFQLVLALGAVIAIMYFLLKFINKRTQSFQSHKTMQNLGGVPLGQNKSVQLIKVGERLLVVGVGDSIQLLKEIETEEEVAEFLDNDQKSGKEGFTGLREMLAKPWAGKNRDSESSSFQDVLEKQLGEMKSVRKKARRRLKEYDQ